MYGSDLKKRLGIILTVVGAILACAVPFALVVLRHQQLEELSHPTPEELKATPWPLISATAGMLVSAAGVWFIFQASKK